MPTLIDRLLGSRKSFVEPAFWSSDVPLWGAPIGDKEQVGDDFAGYIAGLYKTNGVVFACMTSRMFLFTEARFAWQPFRNGQPRSLFSNAELGLLERPWLGGTTGDLLGRMLQDADLAGNAFHTTVDDAGNYGRAATGAGRRIARLRPDWVSIILGSKSGNPRDIDARPIGYLYSPPGAEKVTLLPDEVSHFAPIPDPEAAYRGMSWLTPVVREIQADKAATRHKLKFFEQGATISTVVSLDKEVSPDAFDAFVKKMRAQTEGVDNAYKTLFLGGGADVTLNGSSMKELDMKASQGAGETRIASAGGVHPVVVGLSEGLAGSSLNAGNFEAAIRFTADKTIRPLWRNAAGSLERLLQVPGSDTRLWYDDRDVAFLSDNTKDVAEIQQKQAATASSLLSAGFTPASVVEFIDTNSLTVLEHSGLYSVQLQMPGSLGEVANTPGGAKAESAARILQQIYLSVGTVISTDEARQLVNQITGTSLPIPAPDLTNDPAPNSAS